LLPHRALPAKRFQLLIAQVRERPLVFNRVPDKIPVLALREQVHAARFAKRFNPSRLYAGPG